MPVAGFRRVTSGSPCAFCSMLASRGAVYSRRGADFQAHDGCSCSPEPVWEREPEPPEVVELQRQWREVTAGKSGKDALRAWRRHVEGGGLTRPPATVKLADAVSDLPAWRRALAERQAALERTLAGKPTSTRPLGHGEMGDTSLVEFGPARVVHKTLDRGRDVRNIAESADAEELAPLVAQAVGVPAPAVVRKAGAQVLDMEFVDGKLGAEVVPWGEKVGRELAESDRGRLLGLLDAIMVNGDRNVGNWLLDRVGNLIAIDHGMAFDVDDVDAMRYHTISGNDFASHFVQRPPEGQRFKPDGWASSNDMHPDDMAEIRERLQSLRDDFVRVGRLAWWQAMMKRVDTLAAAARGTRRRLP